MTSASDRPRLFSDAQVEALRTLSLSRRAMLGAGAAAVTTAMLPGSAAGQGAVIDITRARTDPMPIAVPDFAGAQPWGAQIAQVITANLARSGLFRPVDRRAFVTQGAEATPRFADWRAIGAQALVTGRVEQQGDRLRVEFRLWDVLPGQQIQGTAYTTPIANWRRISHICSDAIYERLLGEKGYFDTRIVYIAESGPRDRRIKRLAIMDQDSENHRFLTDGSWLALTPRFHPSVNQVAFMSYIRNEPRVYLLEVDTGRQTLLGNFPGMTFAPRFAPDGNSVLLSAIRGGDANIYIVDLRTRQERQLTLARRLALGKSRRAADRLQQRPRRQPAALRDERRRLERAADQLRPGPLRHAGMVAARRPDRLHPHHGGQLRDRRDASRRLGRAHPLRRLPDGGADLRAERPRARLLPRDAGT